jgi:hypothetical protein
MSSQMYNAGMGSDPKIPPPTGETDCSRSRWQTGIKRTRPGINTVRIVLPTVNGGADTAVVSGSLSRTQYGSLESAYPLRATDSPPSAA